LAAPVSSRLKQAFTDPVIPMRAPYCDLCNVAVNRLAVHRIVRGLELSVYESNDLAMIFGTFNERAGDSVCIVSSSGPDRNGGRTAELATGRE
jgi:hypothetical protein